MHRYIIKRFLLIIPVVFFVSFIVYWLLDLAPGDLAIVLASDDMTKEEIEVLRESLGLNDHVVIRWARYMGGVLRGDFGKSLRNNSDIWEQYSGRWPTTVKLAISSELVTILISIPMGILAARKQNSWIDRRYRN